MAYAALISLDQTLEQILQSQSEDEYQLFIRKEQLQLRSLHGKIHHFMSFLENSFAKNSETISLLEGRIRDATYEAEDLIESHITKQIKSKPSICSGVVGCFRELADVLHHCARCLGSTRQNFEEKLENVILKLNLILEEVETMEESVEGAVKMYPRHSPRAITSRPVPSNKSEMVGFEEDRYRIVELLVGSSSRLETISIVGMGGIGKTTLARHIYDDSLVKSHFHIRSWTTVSQDNNVRAVVVDLLNSIGIPMEYPTDGGDMMLLIETLYKILKGKRYLIVIDDVWDSNILMQLKRIFPDDDNGSRLIITTRLSSVVGSYDSHVYNLKFWSLEESWNLLRQKVFGEEWCPPELEDIGKKIAEDCKGLPLALVVVGSILQQAEKTPQQWEYVSKKMISAPTQNDDRLMDILSLSYKHLPYHLRACLLYMAVFPEDFKVRVSHLIMLWIANGFIKPDSITTLEDIAKEYLEDLINRNLIMVHETYASGEIKTCVVHDLIRELCIKKVEEERFLLVMDNGTRISPGALSRYRHLTIFEESARLSLFDDVYDSSLRSILCFGDQLKNVPFQLLKVFEARETIFDRFPIELLQLVNLKYIALVCFKTSEIPSSISELHRLQTLLVFVASRDGKIILPSEILNMPQIRHVWVEGGILHHCSDGKNENLQTICGVRNFILTEKGIGMFPNLKSLGLTYDKTEWVFSGLENLVHLCRLEFLKLRIEDSFLELPLGTNLSFPERLRKLSLRGFRLSWEQMSIIGSLPNLEVLKLKYVEFDAGEGWKINEDEFPELKFLLLRWPDKFSWDLEGIAFPKLECLTLDGMYDLDCLPLEFGESPTLRVINLYNCPSSVMASARDILEEQRDYGNEDIQLHIYSGDANKVKFMDYMLYGD